MDNHKKKGYTNEKKGQPKLEFDESSRKSFLLGLQNKKKRKEKKAKIMAKEMLRKARAEIRSKKKEKQEETVQELVQKQAALGIKSLPIFTDGPNGIEIPMIEVDPNQESESDDEEEEQKEKA